METHSNHKIAKQQMANGFGSIISILVKGGLHQTLNVAGKLSVFKHATSLGGVKGLIEHPRRQASIKSWKFTANFYWYRKCGRFNRRF